MVVLAGFAFSLALQTLVREDVYFSGDGGMKAVLARHFATWPPRLDLGLSAPEWVSNLWRQGLYPMEYPTVFHIGDVWYAHFAFPFPLASAAPFALFGFRGLYLLPLLSTWVLWLTVWRVARARAWTPVETALVLAVVIFASPVTFYSATFWEHNLAIALALLGLLPLLTAGERPSWRATFASGLAMGFSIWFRDELLCAAALAVLFILWTRWRGTHRSAALAHPMAWLAGTASSAGLYFSTNSLLYGHPLGIHSFTVIKDGFSIGSQLANGAGMFLDLGRLLLATFPVVIFVAVFALPRLLPARSGEAAAAERPVAWFLLLFCITVPLVLPPRHYDGYGGKQWGPRFWLLAVPLAALLVPSTLRWARQLGHRAARFAVLGLFVSLLVVSFWLNAVQASALLAHDYGSRVLPALTFLKHSKVRSVAVDHQSTALELLSGLERSKNLLLVRDGSALVRFAQALEQNGEREFILVRLGDRPLPPALRIDDRLAVRFEPIGSGGIYSLFHGEVIAR
jgi:hypothetical protein